MSKRAAACTPPRALFLVSARRYFLCLVFRSGYKGKWWGVWMRVTPCWGVRRLQMNMGQVMRLKEEKLAGRALTSCLKQQIKKVLRYTRSLINTLSVHIPTLSASAFAGRDNLHGCQAALAIDGPMCRDSKQVYWLLFICFPLCKCKISAETQLSP